LIRNHNNGWAFVENSVSFPSAESKEEVCREAIAAVDCCGLDFGAVDVVLGKEDEKAYVLEVNTAPGLESTALIEAYKRAFRNE